MARDLKHNWFRILAYTANNGVFKEARSFGIRPQGKVLSEMERERYSGKRAILDINNPSLTEDGRVS